VRRADGRPRAVGCSANGNGVMYDDLWTIEQAREAIEEGHKLYVVSTTSGERTELDLESYDDLEDLPPCG
jgi:ribosomal protein S18 acetylase RimI-like enzyme